MSEAPPGAIERILLAIDGSPHSLAAMRAAVDLSAGLEAELIAVFVEDVNLLRTAELPIFQEVSHYTASVRRLVPERMLRQFRAQASTARLALARQARQAGIDWEFRVARGDISLELLARAEEADLIILGRVGWSRGRVTGSTARLMIRQAPGLVMVLQETETWSMPVLVVYDGSPAGLRALIAGQRVAELSHHPLSVMVIAGDQADSERLEAEARQALEATSLHVSFTWVRVTRTRQLVNLIGSMQCLLVVPAELAGLAGAPLIELVDDLDGPVLVAR